VLLLRVLAESAVMDLFCLGVLFKSLAHNDSIFSMGLQMKKWFVLYILINV